MELFSKKKGQYLAIEYVFFFAIGVSLIVSVYFLFNNINVSIQETSSDKQMERVGELVRGSIITVFETANATNSTINYNLSIPTKLARCVYAIQMKENLNINCTDNYKIGSVLSLYGINTKTKNIIYSSKGVLQITSEGDSVVLK